MRELMRAFERDKKAFRRASGDMYIDLPKPLAQLNVPGVVDQGKLVIRKYAFTAQTFMLQVH